MPMIITILHGKERRTASSHALRPRNRKRNRKTTLDQTPILMKMSPHDDQTRRHEQQAAELLVHLPPQRCQRKLLLLQALRQFQVKERE